MLTIRLVDLGQPSAYIDGNIDATWSISVGGVGRTAVASTDGNLFRAVGTLGYDLGQDGNKIRPSLVWTSATAR
ncbi:MAG: hypothetical protein IPP45_02265 [Sphingomonadales bacterium]|nr:hypothetical protein [Sphingomonadales bacterium]